MLDGLAANPDGNGAIEVEVRKEVRELYGRFPIYAIYADPQNLVKKPDGRKCATRCGSGESGS